MSETKTKTDAIRLSLIAPCGMNCGLCRAYRRERNACPGCRGADDFKPKTRVLCQIKTCEKMAGTKTRFCSSDCDGFPCIGLARLDERYRRKYGMSMITNLTMIHNLGIRRFVREEKEKWACPGCGEMICVHEARCLSCQRRWRE